MSAVTNTAWETGVSGSTTNRIIFRASRSKPGGREQFAFHRVPALRELAAFAAEVCVPAETVAWDEFAIELAGHALRLASGASTTSGPPSSEARVARAVRRIESEPFEPLTLDVLAAEAGLSPFHFLRTFQQVAGVTPHQYLLRVRLRHAAVRLATGQDKVLDIALDSGFGDVSNFNRTFRAEFGLNPRAYRARLAVP